MKALRCKFFGHKYVVSRNVTKYVKEYSCSKCSKQLTTNSQGNLTSLTPEFKEINDVLEVIHERKNRIRLKTTHLHEGLLVFSH